MYIKHEFQTVQSFSALNDDFSTLLEDKHQVSLSNKFWAATGDRICYIYQQGQRQKERKASCAYRASICTSSMTLEEELLEARAEQRALEMAEELKTKYDQLKEFRHANMFIYLFN